MIEIGDNIEKAVQLLKEGSLVGVPTETVYGLGADASNSAALEKLFEAKGRPRSHPVIVHIADWHLLEEWVETIPPSVEELAKRFWPGPLTMIFRKRSTVSPQVTGGQDTVAIRIPRHELTLALLKKFEGGIAAPSANKFGKLSPTTAHDVACAFGDQVAYVLDGGTCDVGIESTILDVTGTIPTILRPGMISKDELEEVLGTVELRSAGENGHAKVASEGEIRAPGSHKSHYAPNTPVKLVDQATLEKELADLIGSNQRPGVLAFQHPKMTLNSIPWIVAEEEPEGYAKHLYANLRQLDDCRCDWILVEQVPESSAWQGIKDRLLRASHR
jgi:Sua5/YciO/YrdC/YwlC family protein